MTRGEVYQEARKRAVLTITLLDGRTSSEVERLTGYTKASVSKVIEKYRKHGITSKRSRDRKAYYYVTDMNAVMKAIDECYPELYVCKECGESFIPSEMYAHAGKISDMCRACFTRIIERDGLTCITCGKKKPLSCFSVNRYHSSGYNSACKECNNSGKQKSISRVQGFGFQSWAIIDTTVHLPLFLALGEKYGC
jgi:hypothetical protein